MSKSYISGGYQMLPPPVFSHFTADLPTVKNPKFEMPTESPPAPTTGRGAITVIIDILEELSEEDRNRAIRVLVAYYGAE